MFCVTYPDRVLLGWVTGTEIRLVKLLFQLLSEILLCTHDWLAAAGEQQNLYPYNSVLAELCGRKCVLALSLERDREIQREREEVEF